MQTGSILLVDDDRHLAQSMADWLGEQGHDVETAGDYDQALKCLGQRPFDVMLLDVRLPGRDGFEVLRYAVDKHPATSIIMMSGYAPADLAVEAVEAGALTMMTKPLIDQELEMFIQQAFRERTIIEENDFLRKVLDQQNGMGNIIGRDPRMKKIFEIIKSVADSRATILITGESGTGKSMIARAIHNQSNRKGKPFVEVACGALPETLLESELFGHVAGAFTGASANKIGKFEQAHQGTIFLDEIATASTGLQVKMLRVLQDLEFEPVGSVETKKIDTRVVLATNENLEAAVRDGRFRQDLFYRVNVINIELPPLRDRISDIPELARDFLVKVCKDSGRNVQGFTERATTALQRYNWPGNVRELQNVVERAVLLGKGHVVDVDDLPVTLAAGSPTVVGDNGRKTLKEALAGPERQIILEVLESNSWNRNETADILGINRTTLYKKMKRLGLEEPLKYAQANF